MTEPVQSHLPPGPPPQVVGLVVQQGTHPSFRGRSLTEYEVFMYRGTECWGYQWRKGYIFYTIVVGCVVVVFATLMALASATSLVIALFGVAAAVFGIYLRNKARAEWRALPPDHPDRTTYLRMKEAHDAKRLRQTLSSYNMPPGTQIVTIPADTYVAPMSATGSSPLSPGLPPAGQNIRCSGASFPGSPLSVPLLPSGTPSALHTDSSVTANTLTYMDNDPPPSYTEVMRLKQQQV